MHADNTVTNHKRTVRFTEIPSIIPGAPSELDVTFAYVDGSGAVFRAVTLDNVVIPAVIAAINRLGVVLVCPCCDETFIESDAIHNDDGLVVCPHCAEIAE